MRCSCSSSALRDVVAVDQHAAGRRAQQADHVAQQRRLAAARAADDDEHLAAPHLAGDVVEDHLVAVARLQMLDLDRGGVRSPGDGVSPDIEQHREHRVGEDDGEDAGDDRRRW